MSGETPCRFYSYIEMRLFFLLFIFLALHIRAIRNRVNIVIYSVSRRLLLLRSGFITASCSSLLSNNRGEIFFLGVIPSPFSISAWRMTLPFPPESCPSAFS